MLLKHLTPIIDAELICLGVAIVCLFKNKSKVWRSMILFMLITCLTELGGLYIRRVLNQGNDWLYNIYTIFELGFPSLMFAHLLGKYRNSKPLILTGLAVTIFIYIIELLGYHILGAQDLAISVMSVCFVVYSLVYYYLIIKDETYINLKFSAAFWWVSGALFYYFGSTANNLFFKIIFEQNQVTKGGVSAASLLSYNISTALNIMMYVCWSYSFICKKWLTK
ncbi:MAG: hypothetical protein V4592_19150 [Bacteroidota bacterium]